MLRIDPASSLFFSSNPGPRYLLVYFLQRLVIDQGQSRACVCDCCVLGAVKAVPIDNDGGRFEAPEPIESIEIMYQRRILDRTLGCIESRLIDESESVE